MPSRGSFQIERRRERERDKWGGGGVDEGEKEREGRKKEKERHRKEEHLLGMHSTLIALSASCTSTLLRVEPLKKPSFLLLRVSTSPRGSLVPRFSL